MPEGPHRVGFLLLPRFQMLGYVLATETLRLANKVAGRAVFEWRTVGPAGRPVAASNAESARVDGDVAAAGPCALVVVCAGYEPLDALDAVSKAWLRRRARHGGALGGLDTGAVVLAELGLLGGYRAVVHHEAAAAFRETYPDVVLDGGAYVHDRDRLTAAGGMATGDAMLAWIAAAGFSDLAAGAATALVHGETRGIAAMPGAADARGPGDPLVERATALMSTTLEEPLAVAALARRLAVDGRLLTRRFRAATGRPPAAVYMAMRLDRARDLLAATDMTAAEVAGACGFASAVWFSQAYVKRFGVPPKRHRAVLRSAVGAGIGRRDAPSPFTADENAV